MITPILEKCILSGRGIYRTLPIYLTGTGKLPVPKGKFIVIHSLIVHPTAIIESPNAEAGDSTAIDKYSINQIDMFSKNINRNTYLVRSNFECLADPSNVFYVKNSPPVTIDMLQVADHDVYFQISRFTGVVGNTAITYGKLQNTQLPPVPTAQGITINTLLRLRLQNNSEYQPNTTDETGLAMSGVTFFHAATNIDGSAPIPEPSDYHNYNSFLMQVNYIEFSEQAKKDFV